jgi:hypothetical protein
MGSEIMVESPLVGRHQLRNLALAVAAAEELHDQGFAQITPETIARGIRETHWPGRFQVVPAAEDNPGYVLDVAHNPAGSLGVAVDAFVRLPESCDGDSESRDDHHGVWRDARQSGAGDYRDSVSDRRACDRDPRQQPTLGKPRTRFGRQRRVWLRASILKTLRVYRVGPGAGAEVAGQGGLIVVTGSIYIVGEAMRMLGVRI